MDPYREWNVMSKFFVHCSSVRLRYQLQPWPAGAKTPVNFAIETFGYQMDRRNANGKGVRVLGVGEGQKSRIVVVEGHWDVHGT